MFLDEHLNQLWDVVAVHPAVSPLRSIYRVFCRHQCCIGFLNFSPHLVAMILLLVKLILWTTLRNSIKKTRSLRITRSLLSTWSLVFMHIAFQWTLQAVCRREQLRLILFDKIAVLFVDRTSNCTEMLSSENVSKYFCMVRLLLLTSRIVFPLSHLDYPSDSQSVKNTACLPVLRLTPPGN